MAKVVMAYSGGLDASVCIHWLRHSRGYEVITFSADLGQDASAELLARRALALGAGSALTSDLREKFLKEVAFPSIKAGARTFGGSYLGTALSRPFITAELVRIAKEENCEFIAHGGRGKSNDLARFRACVDMLAPHLQVLAPLVGKQFLSRKTAVEYAKKNGLPLQVTEPATYSYDQNLWGTSIGSIDIEDLWAEPPPALFASTKSPEEAPDKPAYMEIDFEEGEPVAVNGERLSPIELVELINKLGGENAIGRLDSIETKITGIKVRIVSESPAAHLLGTALLALEDIVLTKELLEHKRYASIRYTRLVHEGLWFLLEREALDNFFNKAHKYSTGSVRLKLYKGNCMVVGRKSKFSLYDRGLATIGQEEKFDYADVQGFLNIVEIPVKLESNQRKLAEED
ncbi:MAG: argininosuccinate synthase [Planctomycetota bacterium]